MSDRAICSILSTDWKGKVMRVIVIQAFVPSPFHQSLRYVKIKKKDENNKRRAAFFWPCPSLLLVSLFPSLYVIGYRRSL